MVSLTESNITKKIHELIFYIYFTFRFPNNYRTTMYVATEHVAVTRHVTKHRKPVYLKVRVLLAGPSTVVRGQVHRGYLLILV